MKKIGIIGAMELEVEHIKEHMQIRSTYKAASMEFKEGTINGTEVVVVRSGVGKVNAGICVQILVDKFQVSHVINTGIAGSLDARINIGDVVLSTELVYHDLDATAFGYPLGEVPQLGVREFVADKGMIESFKRVIKEIEPELGIFEGRIVSGDQFIASKDRKKWIVENFHGLCCEMEGAAIAQACYLNQIPFIVMRMISDKADDSAEMDYPSFEKMAARNSSKITEQVISRI